MAQVIKQEITVQTDSVIEIHSPALKLGAHVEVILLLEEVGSAKKLSLHSLIGAGRGSFATPDEADAFIRKERNKWE